MKINAIINKVMKNLNLREFNSKKGIVFTLEALITFSIFIIVISFVYNLVQQQSQSSILYEKVFLDDIFQVLELNYHDDIVIFETEGKISNSLEQYLHFIKNSTGKSVFISYKERFYSPDSLCNPSNISIITKRLVTYPSIFIHEELSEINNSAIDSSIIKINYFHSLNLGIC